MMSMCLANSLSLTAKVQLLTYTNEYIFDGVEYAPLMYKVIMRLATIDSVATTQTLRDNLQNLSVFLQRLVAISTKSTLSSTRITHRFWPKERRLTTRSTFSSTPTLSFPATTSKHT